MNLRAFILVIWALILNLYVFPVILYGPDLVPDFWDRRYAIQIFAAIISAVYLSTILDWIFEK
jgi:hypothetical protein